MTNVRFTNHAKMRMAQRGISYQSVFNAVRKCSKIHRTGVVFVFVGRKEIEQFGFEENLNGLTVIFNEDENSQEVKTVYKNRNAISVIKKKSKNDLRKFYLKGFTL